jgi:hypothetical protein
LPNLFSSPGPGLTIWSLLYVSDYTFTIVCARLYRRGVNEKFAVEGSFELTPFFQKDIDSLKVISPRFLAMLLLSGTLLTLTWFLSSQSTPELYEFVLGALILVQLAVHTRHIRNFFMFRMFAKSDYVRGRIEYSRIFVLRASASELFAFAGFLLVLFAFTPSWFLLGGIVSCALTALKHVQLARKAVASSFAAGQPQKVTPQSAQTSP